MHVGRRPFARARNQACLSFHVMKLCCMRIPRYSRIWENEQSVRKYTRAHPEDTCVRSKHTKYISVIYSRPTLSTYNCAIVAHLSGLKMEESGCGSSRRGTQRPRELGTEPVGLAGVRVPFRAQMG